MVFLDSGQSADESAFLDLYRYSLHSSYQRQKPFYGRFWVIYPTSDQSKRYGWVAHHYGEDAWMTQHTRPRKILNEDRMIGRYMDGREWVLSRGIARAMGRFELNTDKYSPGSIPAYRRNQRDPSQRATVVMLNPTGKDFDYVTKAVHFWHQRRRIPRMVLGSHVRHALPPNFHNWLWGILCWSREEQSDLMQRLAGTRINVRFMNWHAICDRRWRETTVYWSFPGAMGHSRRIRKPELGRFLLDRMGSESSFRIGTQDDSWKEGASATDCKTYVILSHSEGDAVPFDARIALARGARVIAPDIPVYRALETSRKTLYPCRLVGHNGAAWSPMDLASWFNSHYSLKTLQRHGQRRH